MAAERKLKGEIDRTLKKVQEGQELFEELWVQVHECDNSNQREKLEGELKKEIKKLQRLREQIKAWIAGADIKDKQPLMDARKSIEKDMERFKVCEREMKMAGRAGAPKAADPKEKAKDDARDWLNNTVEALTAKVEEFEYEMEELQGSLKKKSKPPPRLTELEGIVTQHKDHVSRLEKVLRCIDNETIAPDELENLRNDMDAYLNGEAEDNGIDFSNVDSLYDELLDRLDAVDQAAPAAAVTGHGKHSKQAKDKEEAEREREREKENERQRAAAAAAKAQLIAQGNNNIKLNDEDDSASRAKAPGPAPAKAAAATATAAVAAPAAAPPPPPPPTAPPATPPPRTAVTPSKEPAPADVATTAPSTPRGAPITTGLEQGATTPVGRAGAAPAGAAGMARAPTPVAAPAAAGAAAAAASTAPQPPGGSNWLSAATTGPGGTAAAAPPPAGAAVGADAGRNFVQRLQAGGAVGPSPAGTPAGKGAGKALGRADSVGGPVDGAVADGGVGLAGSSAQAGVEAITAAAKALSLEAESAARAAAAAPLEPINLIPAMPAFPASAARQILESAYMRALPQASDTDWKRYRPRHPVAVPASYPRAPHEVIDNPALFRKVDPECLFFAFYFQPDSYAQYLAAHELKRQSWRFHKHHNAWFQRFTEPTVTSDEYEQGAYVYFDYNIVHDDLQTGWCYRRKEAFTFRYDALEDELRVQS